MASRWVGRAASGCQLFSICNVIGCVDAVTNIFTAAWVSWNSTLVARALCVHGLMPLSGSFGCRMVPGGYLPLVCESGGLGGRAFFAVVRVVLAVW